MIHDLGLLAARLLVGEGMAAHGAQKAFGWFEGPGPEGAAKVFHAIGFRPASVHAAAAAWNEQLAGHLIAAGLGGPVGPALLIANMSVAAVVNSERGFFAAKNGMELPLTYIAAALALTASGYGALSLDHLFGLDRKLRHPLLTTLGIAGAMTAALVVINGREAAAPAQPATPTFQGKNSPLPRAQTDASRTTVTST